MLGLTSEQYPKGGALTLNTVSAMGLLTVGIFGFPFLGAVQDNYDAKAVLEAQPAIVEIVKAEERTTEVKGEPELIVQEKVLFGVKYPSINADAIMAQDEFPEEGKEPLNEVIKNTGRKTLRVAAVLPIIMVLGFLTMLLWFKAHGGYKPVQLLSDGDSAS